MWSGIHARNKKQTNLDFIVSAEFGQIRVKLFDAQQKKKKNLKKYSLLDVFAEKKTILCI